MEWGSADTGGAVNFQADMEEGRGVSEQRDQCVQSTF